MNTFQMKGGIFMLILAYQYTMWDGEIENEFRINEIKDDNKNINCMFVILLEYNSVQLIFDFTAGF